MKQHKGKIIKKAVSESGYTITRLTQKMGRSRRWIYQIFEKENVSVDYILEIGRIIHHDFSHDIKELKEYKFSSVVQRLDDQEIVFYNDTQKAEHWKNKYLILLEQYNELLLSMHNDEKTEKE